MLENSERNEIGRNQSIYGSENFKRYNPEVTNSIMDMDLLSYISGENKFPVLCRKFTQNIQLL